MSPIYIGDKIISSLKIGDKPINKLSILNSIVALYSTTTTPPP